MKNTQEMGMISGVERQEGEDIAKYLRRLEQTHRYLFHGSPKALQTLEPRNPTTDATDNPENKHVAVYAYDSAALGIQRAIVDRSAVQGEWDIIGGTDPQNPDVPLLMTTPNIVLGEGYVYVLSKEAFRHTGGYQWVCENTVSPLVAVKVDAGTYEALGGTYKMIE